ncbi:MAG: FAD-dependent monooxygenase [Solirubrobacterales bacterium]|nr:FAD-dependent monooxygenase [Solirubrobacterales bacterium]
MTHPQAEGGSEAQETDYDVVIVGYGPTGEMLAILLGQLGYRVGVFERWPEVYALPRAVHFDDEIGRILQAAGLREEVLEITDPVLDLYEWRNRDGEALLRIDWSRPGTRGWPSANFFSQPELQRVLDRRAKSLATVEVREGWEVGRIEDRGDHVHVEVQRGDSGQAGEWIAEDDVRWVTARYLIGADGANSAVREIIGSEWHDLGFVPVRLADPRSDPARSGAGLEPDELAVVRSDPADHDRVGRTGPASLGVHASAG